VGLRDADIGRIGAFIPVSVRPYFTGFLGQVFAQQGKVSCEMPVQREGQRPFFVQIEAVADASGRECRLAAIVITERRVAETELAEKNVNSKRSTALWRSALPRLLTNCAARTRC
jgi:hypothetical protein